MKLKPVFRIDPFEPKLRLFRLMWERGTVGDGRGYSAKFAVSLVPALWGWSSVWDGWRMTVCGVCLHYQRAYGGRFV